MFTKQSGLGAGMVVDELIAKGESKDDDTGDLICDACLFPQLKGIGVVQFEVGFEADDAEQMEAHIEPLLNRVSFFETAMTLSAESCTLAIDMNELSVLLKQIGKV